jgi:pimeloyl-ACP methyl ester carboxylesterase
MNDEPSYDTVNFTGEDGQRLVLYHVGRLSSRPPPPTPPAPPPPASCPVHPAPALLPTATLILHSNGFHALSHGPMLSQLSRCLEVFALDLRGHGASAPLTGELSYVAMARDALRALECIRETYRERGSPLDRVVAFGHSLGGAGECSDGSHYTRMYPSTSRLFHYRHSYAIQLLFLSLFLPMQSPLSPSYYAPAPSPSSSTTSPSS